MKNMKWLFILISVMLLLNLAIIACNKPAPATPPTTSPGSQPTTQPAAQPEKPIILKYGVGEPPTHFWSEAATVMMKKIEEETNGRVQFETYFAATLINPRECFTEIAGGVADISALPIGLAPGGKLEVERALMGAYYGSADLDKIRSISESLRAKYPEFESDWAEYGKIIAWSSLLPFQLQSTKPINKIDDLGGMTIRAWPDVTPVFDKLGAESLTMPSPDVYSALQKGTLDGATSAWEQLKTYKWAEVTDYHIRLDMSTGGYAYTTVMNWDTWNSLPPDIQKVFDDNLDTWVEENSKRMVQADEGGLEFARELGNTIVDLPAQELNKFYGLLDDNFLEIMAALDGKGYNATAIYKELRRLIEE
jgi:TRAP-type C4-dicarboxylate transport system substrate-binding protein